ncbi:MAG: hypothetical protein R3C05_20885 [Pirellulaceae bacterium]
MPASGSEILMQLQSAVEAAKAEREVLQTRHQEVLRRSDALLAERGETFVELAEHYLPELNQQNVQRSWAEIRPKIQDVLLRKEDRHRELLEQLKSLQERKLSLDQQLDGIKLTLQQVSSRRDELSKQLSENLAGDPDFQTLTDQAAIAEVNLQRAEASLAEIEHEVIAKLPAYQRSHLFQYLLRRKMGTPQYTARGVWRRWDQWIGRLIDFPKARKSYAFLSEVPEKMRELIAQRRDALHHLLDQLESKQQVVSSELGLDQVLDQIHETHQQRDAMLRDIEQVVVTINETHASINELLDGEGPFYREAIQYYKRLLEQTETYTLELRAAQSPEPVDDQLVARLKHIDEELQQFKRDAQQRRDELQDVEEHVEAIQYVTQQFQRAQFDNARSYFDDGIDLSDNLLRLRDGRERPDTLWQHIRRHQHTAPNWYEESSRRVAGTVNSPLGQILLQTMAHAAGAALRENARRAGARRISQAPAARQSVRPAMPTPRRSGFSTRSGF